MIRKRKENRGATEAPADDYRHLANEGNSLEGFACEASEGANDASAKHPNAKQQKQMMLLRSIRSKLEEVLGGHELKRGLGKYEEGRKLLEVMSSASASANASQKEQKHHGVIEICIGEMGICFGGYLSRDSICQRCGVREICKQVKERESN